MDMQIDIECMKCKRKFQRKLKNLTPGRTIKCPACGAAITVEGDGFRKAQASLDRLERDMKNLSKGFKIKP